LEKKIPFSGKFPFLDNKNHFLKKIPFWEITIFGNFLFQNLPFLEISFFGKNFPFFGNFLFGKTICLLIILNAFWLFLFFNYIS